MSKDNERITLPADWEACDENPIDAMRFGEEVLRACKTAEGLNVPVTLDTDGFWMMIRPDHSAVIRPKKR